MTRIKICGIKTLEDARAVAAAGADELGFHVGLEGARSPLPAESAAKIIAELPSSTSAVMVTSVTDPEKLIELAQATGAITLQLYGDATQKTIQEVKTALPYMVVWKVVNVGGEDVVARAKQYEGTADAIVLDSTNKEGQLGGTGKTHDWSISKKIRESISLPVILAGGLTPENIVEAIRTVRPYGVDVNSGVSNPDGSKYLEKVKLFIERAKTA